jgi:hypothetical protein
MRPALSALRSSNYRSRFTGIEEFSPDGLLTRYIAIDVPEASVAGFENSFLIAFKMAGFHDVEGKYESAEPDRHHLY